MPINLIALLLIGGTIAFYIWFLFFRRRGFGGIADRINLPHRRAALLLFLSFLAVVVWLLGGLNFAVLMVLPAWLWPLIEASANRKRKIINIVLAVVGIAPFLVTLTQLPAGFNLWHILLAAAYGILWPIDILLFLMLVALFIRFLRLGLSTPYTVVTTIPTQSELIERLLK